MITEDVSVEFDDSTVWEAVEDAVNDAAREVVRDYAWEEVSSDVESMIDEMRRDGDSTEGIDDHLASLLDQLRGRTEREE